MSRYRQQRRARVGQASACELNPSLTTENGELTTPSEARLSTNCANTSDEAALLSEPKTQETLSTGPRTQEGKAASSQNSFKHGLYSKQLVIKGEDPAELDALKADLIAEHQPDNVTEEILVNEMAEHYWRLKRFRHTEAVLMNAEALVMSQIEAVQRFMKSAEHGFHKALKALGELQKRKGHGCAPLDSEAVPAALERGACHRARFGRVPEQARGFVPTKSTEPECVARKSGADDRFVSSADTGSHAALKGVGFVSPKSAQTEPLLDDDAAFEAQCEMFEAYLDAA